MGNAIAGGISHQAKRSRMLNSARDRLVAYISPRSLGGVSLFSGSAVISRTTITEFLSDDRTYSAALEALTRAGFTIDRVSGLSVRISAAAGTYEQVFGIQFEHQEHRIGLGGTAFSYLAPSATTAGKLLELPARLSTTIEGVAFPEPIQLHQVKDPPSVGYHHLRAPEDVARHLRATEVHEQGVLGQGVRAAMIDSGFGWDHPYFRSRGYSTRVVPDGDFEDANGHGTGESANFLAVAPKAELFGLSMADVVEAIQIARDDLKVQILSNSWGSRADTDGPNGTWTQYWALVQAEIVLCAERGVVVLFSGGNGGLSFTASMPETISVGGVYIGPDGSLSATPYASSFDSTRFPGQHVPDVCGLVGLPPRAIYIALPVPPECEIDQELSQARFPDGDETSASDGWAVFSGTSAACPMVAGIAALALSKYPEIPESDRLESVRARLCRARDVTQGRSAQGESAGPGWDPATGHGLADAVQACA